MSVNACSDHPCCNSQSRRAAVLKHVVLIYVKFILLILTTTIPCILPMCTSLCPMPCLVITYTLCPMHTHHQVDEEARDERQRCVDGVIPV